MNDEQIDGGSAIVENSLVTAGLLLALGMKKLEAK